VHTGRTARSSRAPCSTGSTVDWRPAFTSTGPSAPVRPSLESVQNTAPTETPLLGCVSVPSLSRRQTTDKVGQLLGRGLVSKDKWPMKCTTSKLLTCRLTNGGPIRSAFYVVSQSKKSNIKASASLSSAIFF